MNKYVLHVWVSWRSFHLLEFKFMAFDTFSFFLKIISFIFPCGLVFLTLFSFLWCNCKCWNTASAKKYTLQWKKWIHSRRKQFCYASNAIWNWKSNFQWFITDGQWKIAFHFTMNYIFVFERINGNIPLSQSELCCIQTNHHWYCFEYSLKWIFLCKWNVNICNITLIRLPNYWFHIFCIMSLCLFHIYLFIYGINYKVN